jgi:hypothetical protein
VKTDRQRDAEMDRLLDRALRPAAPVQAGDCPAAGDLAAFVEGSLGAAERHRLEGHVSACDNCQQALAAIARMPPTDAAGPLPVRETAPFARWLRWLVPAGATALLLLVYFAVNQPKPARPDMQLARSEMPGRVAPPAETQRSTPPPETPPASVVSRGEREQARAEAPDRTAEAVRRIVTGKSEQVKAAVPKREPSAVAEAQQAVAPPMAAGPARAKDVAQEKRADATGRQGVVMDNLAFLAPPAKPSAAPPPGAAAQAQVAAAQVQAPAGAVVPTPPTAPPAGVAGRPPAAAVRTDNVAESVMLRAAVSAPQNLPGPGPVVVAPDGGTRWWFDRGAAIWRTQDAGTSWQLQRPATTGEVLAGSSPNAMTCWAVGRDGLVLVIADGEHWETRSFVEKVDLVGVSARDARTATVTTRDGRRFTTTDGGATWQPSQD